LNAAIARYANAVLRTNHEKTIKFIAADKALYEEYDSPRQFPLEGGLLLHRATYNYIINKYNGGESIPLEMTTFCDAPPGSGLGSSSTVVVVMVRAFMEFLNLPLDDYELAEIAYKIERDICHFRGGRQDQYAATFGGFNFIEFNKNNKIIVNQLRIKNWIICELESSLVLFYTGISRESAIIIKEQSIGVKQMNQETIEAMHGLKSEALLMKESLLRADFGGVIDSMRRGWENKKRTSKLISSPHIDTVYCSAIRAGALAGKISGAGGGGYMMFFTPPEKYMNVVKALSEFGGVVTNCRFTKTGTQAWTIRDNFACND